MAINLHTYTLGGNDSGKITVVGDTATGANLITRDTATNTAWLYKDYGVDYFSGDFSIKFKFLWNSSSDRQGNVVVISPLSNTTGSEATMGQTYLIGIYYANQTTGDYRSLHYVEEIISGTPTYSVLDGNRMTADVWYYGKFERVGSTAYLYVYSDSARSDLLYTITLSLSGVTACRYHSAFAGAGAGGAAESTYFSVGEFKGLPVFTPMINNRPDLV